jgi:heptosyltransferase-2
MTIVVFCPNAIGDTVMATPAFRALRGGFPGAKLVGVIRPGTAPTLDGAPWFDGLVRFDARSRDARFRTLAVTRTLRQLRPALAVVLPNSFRTGLLAWLSGAPRRVGYSRGGRDLLLTDRLEVPRDATKRRLPVPIVEYYLKIVRHLGCAVDSVQPELFTTEADESAADLAWSRLGLDRADRVIALNTGGAFGPAKNWPAAHFAQLAKRLVDDDGTAVVVLCGPGERDNAREIVKLADHPRVVSLAEEPLGVGLSKACVRRSALLVTTDSGPRHFATAFKVPVLTLFGPTHIAWTRTYHTRAVHVFHPVPCGPCQKPVCPLGHHRCMRDLTPEAVYAAARRLI